MKETQETAIVPTTETTAELIPGQTADLICGKHYQKPQARSKTGSGMAPGETDHRRIPR